ncbi:MAG: cytochrome c biogenesis protein CcdA [Alphaproteobacteria bacterium]|nr:cytochrome c biogenesis protein CcdA [Alphaproteobacteria bacterium]
MSVGFGAALLAGLLSFLSPCVLPLVPGYIGFLKSLDSSNLTTDYSKTRQRIKLLVASTLFVSGFLSVFVALGASASLAGTFLAKNMSTLQFIGGAVIVILGLNFIGILSLNFANRDIRFMPSPKHLGLIGAYIVGLAFGFGWTPCVGPVLATILMISASSNSAVNEGAALLLAYGVGMGTPFVLVALFSDLFLAKFTFFSKKTIIVKWLLGGVLIITGLAIMSGKLSAVGFWLLRNVTVFQGVG